MFNYFKGIRIVILSLSIFSLNICSDSFKYNSFNNHGVIGLINIPSARFLNEGSVGMTLYDGTPDQKITITSSPYNWLEASFYYTNIQGWEYGNGFDQEYKDKGFNFKLRLKEEGIFPALAIGINDIAGTGFYSSEYIVASYGISNLDMHFGLGWGILNGSPNSFKNPLTYIHNSFNTRPTSYTDKGGQFQPSRYFSDEKVSPFYGISYALNDRFLLKIEHDTTTNWIFDVWEDAKTTTSLGFDFNLTKNFTIGFAKERGNYFSIRFNYKNNASIPSKPIKYRPKIRNKDDNNYTHLVKTLESNGIGVNKIVEGAQSIGLEVTQFRYANLEIIEEIIKSATFDSGIEKDIKTDYRIANLKAFDNTEEILAANSKLIYERKRSSKFITDNKFNIRPFIASREAFLKAALLIENDSEYIIKDNFFFTSNLKYSVSDNFQDLTIPPVDTYPAQVRSDVKEYLRNFNERVIIGRAQFDYHVTPKKNHHLMFTAGILEEMFSGYGFEYLYFDNKEQFAFGFELFDVKKRDYELRFGTLNYKNTTGHINLYYRNYNLIPFDAKISYGEYLAGDKGTTLDFSRSFPNGAKFGVFASFTDVTAVQFGEGTFDKGIYFNIPIYKNFVNYSWRPLTKDPGAKLNRKYTLHDLLIKFRPHSLE